MRHHGGWPSVGAAWLAIALLFSVGAWAQEAELVEFDSAMRYIDNSGDPGLGMSWTAPTFDDSGWQEGIFGVGYQVGTGAEGLIKAPVPIGTMSVYARANFSIDNLASIQTLHLGADYDDGVTIWLNGFEIFRSPEMPAGELSWGYGGRGQQLEQRALPELRRSDRHLRGDPCAADRRERPRRRPVEQLAFLVRPGRRPLPRLEPRDRGDPTSVHSERHRDLGNASLAHLEPAGELRGLRHRREQLRDRAGSGFVLDHSVTLTDLTPDTEYFYVIGSPGNLLLGANDKYSFKTAPIAGTPKSTRIWFVGDSGTGNARARNIRDQYRAYTLDRPADVVMLLGDNAYADGTDEEYQEHQFDIFADLWRNHPIWSTLGNHDAYSADSATQTGVYYQIFDLPKFGEAGGVPSGTEAYYSFDWANIHFVVLDSEDTDNSPGRAMLTWLEQDLASTTQDWIIAAFHHPPYSKGGHQLGQPGQALQHAGQRDADPRGLRRRLHLHRPLAQLRAPPT